MRTIALVVLPFVLCATLPAQAGTYSNIVEYSVPSGIRSSPATITVGPDGALWFVEFDAFKIARITTAGVVTNEYAVPVDGFTEALTNGPDGALWFVQNFPSQIGRMTTSGAFTFYSPPTVDSLIQAITTGPDGALWFTESDANTIGRVTTTGDFTFYAVPTADSQPTGITAGPDGALWFTEAGAVGRITTGGLITEYPVSGGSNAITAGPDGALWFTSNVGFTSQAGRITTSGAITLYPMPENSDPYLITNAPDGALWFAESLNGKIGRLTTSGVVTEYETPDDSLVAGITAGPDGNLWFTDYFGGEVERSPACGLGFSAAFTGGTLTMTFDLGIDTPATFDVWVRNSEGLSRPYSNLIPAIVPPRPFTVTKTGIPDDGLVTVGSSLSSSSGQVSCSEWTSINTAQ